MDLDTCRAPCSATWPCSAACTPAGCPPAGRPISGPGRSVSVREGSGSGWTTWWIPSACPLLSLAPLLSSPRLIWVLARCALRARSPSGGGGGDGRASGRGRTAVRRDAVPPLHAWMALSATPPPELAPHQMTWRGGGMKIVIRKLGSRGEGQW